MKLRLLAPRPARLAPLALSAALLLSPGLALAAEPAALPANSMTQAVAQAMQLARQAAGALAPPKARVLVLPGTLDPRLKLAPCDQVQAFLPAGVPSWGRSRVGLRCVKGQGPVAWQVYLPVTVQVWAPAVVTSAPLPAGAQLDESQLSSADVDWAAGTSAPTSAVQSLQGRVLARPVVAGQPVRAADLKARQWFAQGDTVRIVAQGAGFAISAEGQALGPGLEGQRVRVRTDSGRVLVGQAVGHNRVELNL